MATKGKIIIARLVALALGGCAAVGQAASDKGSPLELAVTKVDRQRLESGDDLITVEGRVVNPTDHMLLVPSIHVLVRDSKGLLIDSWEIQPPIPSLDPGASAAFSSSEPNVPPRGAALTLTIGASEERPLHVD